MNLYVEFGLDREGEGGTGAGVGGGGVPFRCSQYVIHTMYPLASITWHHPSQCPILPTPPLPFACPCAAGPHCLAPRHQQGRQASVPRAGRQQAQEEGGGLHRLRLRLLPRPHTHARHWRCCWHWPRRRHHHIAWPACPPGSGAKGGRRGQQGCFPASHTGTCTDR